MESNFQSDCQSIKVDSSQIKDSAFKKHVIYSISGLDSRGNFQVHRRYKEFIALRECLVQSWPGCYIPTIPPKKAIGNLQANFIEQRQQQLERFLIQTAETHFLFNSEDFQVFIRGPEDFIKSSQSLKKPSMIEIGEKYLKTFQEEPENISDEQILEHETFCRATLAKLENFEYKCKKSIANSENFARFLDRTVVGLNQVSEKYKGYAGELGEINPKSQGISPLKKVLVWVQSEILDFYGILDQMKEIQELKKLKEKTIEKVANDKKNLQNFQSGKKTFIQKISKKSESDTIADGEKTLEESSKCLEMIEKVIQITAFRLVKIVMPVFKTKKFDVFKNMIGSYLKENSDDLNGFVNQADQISVIFQH